MLVAKCYLKDIREYEENTGKNLLRLFDNISIRNLVTLLKIFNKGIADGEIYLVIDSYLDQYGLVEAFEEVKTALLGYKEDEEEQKTQKEEQDIEGTADDVNSYQFLYDYYMHLGMQLMSLGITYTEFWSLTTKEMYQVYEAIQQKMILDFNRQMQIAHISAGLTGGAVWGKLPDKAPRINEEEFREEDTVINTKYGEMTLSDYRSLKALEKLGGGINE